MTREKLTEKEVLNLTYNRLRKWLRCPYGARELVISYRGEKASVVLNCPVKRYVGLGPRTCQDEIEEVCCSLDHKEKCKAYKEFIEKRRENK